MLTKLANSSSKRLTAEDKEWIKLIIEGTTKIILSITGQDPLKYAKAARHQEAKSLAITSVSINIPEKKEFRPSDMRERLPDEIKDIHRSDLSRAVRHHDRIGRTAPAENPKNKRGHPKTYEPEKLSGPKKYRKESNIEIFMNVLLSRENVAKLIYRSLQQKGLLFELEKWANLYKFHVMRNYDKEAAWKICKSVFPITDIGTKFNEEYFKIRKIEKRELEKLAGQRAKLQIKKKSPSDYTYIFKNGAYYNAIANLKS
jgi:hypothetical protein